MFAAVVALSLVAAAPEEKEKEKPLPEAAQKELKKFEGKWKATSLIANGNEEPPPDDAILEFKGRKLRFMDADVFNVSALDPSTDPKILDLKAVADLGEISKDKVYEGIYKLDGDTLTIAIYVGAGAKRPAKLESEKDSGVVLVTLKREKK